ncbi:Alpha-aminoadipate reductase [Pseudozyma hubeiensis]|nr:Alpha-aminoadipate reductase [Pseudozyma hubeiensis]
MTSVPEDYVRRELYRHRIFYEGFPVYFVEREGYNLQRMQRGFADFGKIYIAGPSLTGNPTLKIAKDAQGQPVTSEASRDVTEFAHDVLGARVSFGDTATLLAYGYKLDPAPYRKIGWFKVRPSPPDWEKVWSAIPRDRATDLRSARQLLSRQRFITFTTADETGVLGIRLFHDGRQHIKWLVSESPFYSALH